MSETGQRRALVGRLSSPRRELASQFIWSAEGASLVRRYRWFNRYLLGWSVMLDWDPMEHRYLVEDGDVALTVPRKSRLWKYRHGVAPRLDSLAGDFCADRLALRPDELVVDCGANIGEFAYWAARSAHCRVVAIEPDPVEFAALRHNVANLNVTAVEAALWCEPGQRPLYLDNDQGDTTLIDPGTDVATTLVETTTLDEVIAATYPEGVIGLIKVEAEGAEPEILAGASATLSRTRYCTVDVGPERGEARESTAPAVTDLLYEAGFRLQELNAQRPAMLFEAR